MKHNFNKKGPTSPIIRGDDTGPSHKDDDDNVRRRENNPPECSAFFSPEFNKKNLMFNS